MCTQVTFRMQQLMGHTDVVRWCAYHNTAFQNTSIKSAYQWSWDTLKDHWNPSLYKEQVYKDYLWV